jgi:hypothetical protein
MALCAILAISVSADEVKIKDVDGKEITVTFYDDAPVKSTFVNSTNDYVIFDDGFACPSSYIFNDSSSISSSGSHRVNLTNALDFSFLSDNGYYKDAENKTPYTVNNISEIDVPQGITSVCDFVAYNLSTLKKISFPDSVTSFGGIAFQNATGLKECVFEHDINDTLTINSNYMFYNCTNLRAFSFPDCVTSLSGEGYIFWKCSNLTALHLPERLTTITATRDWAPFDYSEKMYFVNEPFSTSDTAPAKPTVYYFPENLSTFPGNTCAFRGCSSLNDVLVFGTGITSIQNKYFFQCKAESTIVFLGDMTTVDASEWRSGWNEGYKSIIFANPADKSSADIASYNTSNTKSVLFCASESDKTKHLESPKHSVISKATCYSNEFVTKHCFCGKQISEKTETQNSMLPHSYIDDFDCTTANYCKNFGEGKCDKFLASDAIAHVEAHDVIFANGFTSAGVHNTYCSNATCKVLDEVEDLEAMFTHEGYAYKERTSGGIDTKFKINTKAMKLYEQYEGALHFGIIVANASHFENVDVFIENGKLTSTNKDGVKSGIQVEMTSRDYDYFNCYIGGFDFANEKHVGLDLIVAGYVYGEDESDVKFIQKDYKTDSDDKTLEIPYTAMVTKGATLKAVNIVTVRDFIPLVEKTEE